MPSPDFWRAIAEQFKNIRGAAWTLTADWADFSNSGTGKWFLKDGSNEAEFGFIAVATRAASQIAENGTSDLLTAWLEELRRNGFGFQEMGFTITSAPGEPEQKRCHYGRIPNLCQMSASFCNRLEADAIQAEFNKRMQDAAMPATSQLKTPELTGNSVGDQLTLLREESRLTAEELSELIGIDTRSVQRHLAGKTNPYDRHLRAYEREFSKLLKRNVVIKKMS